MPQLYCAAQHFGTAPDEQTEARVDVLLDYNKRRKAADTDVFTFLLGKLLENLDPCFHFLPQVQQAVRENAVHFFAVFLDITTRKSEKSRPPSLSAHGAFSLFERRFFAGAGLA